MARINILTETFNADGTTSYGYVCGTIQVQMGSQIVTTRAVKTKNPIRGDEYMVSGFVGRYETSNKPWQAHVDGAGDKVHASFGRDERSGRFNKLHGVSFEPELYQTICNEKFWIAA